MDPITSAIVAVLPGLAAGTLTSLVKDAYKGLKAVIRRKWSESAAVSEAIAALEANSESKAHVGLLDEKIKAGRLSSDVDVVAALQKLVDQLKAEHIGGPAVASIQFTQNGGVIQGVGAAHTVTVNEMNFGAPPR